LRPARRLWFTGGRDPRSARRRARTGEPEPHVPVSLRAAAPFAALAAGVALAWWGRLVLPAGVVAFANSDALTYFYPLYDVAFGWMARGVLPLWNPYQLCGIPWLATLQGGFFYPPHALYLVLPTYAAMALLSVGHLALFAVGTGAFARRLGLGVPAALAAGALIGLRGWAPHLVMFPNWLEGAAWLPLGCLAVHALAHGAGARAAAPLATVTALGWLAGYPQITVYVLYAWATLLVVLLGAARAAPGRWLAAGTWAAGAVVLGTLVAAVQLLPARELAQVGARATEELARPYMFPMGNMGPGLLRAILADRSPSLSALGVALVAAAVVAPRGRAVALWALVVGALATAFAMGGRTPLFRLYLALPLVDWFRIPARILFLTDFCLAVAAAVGLHALGARCRAARGGVLPFVVAAAALALAGAAVAQGSLVGGATTALGAGVVLLAWGTPTHARLVPPLVLALLVAQALLVPPPRLALPFDAATAAGYARHAAAYRALAAAAGPQRAWVYTRGLRPPELSPRLATLHRLRAIDDYEPLNLRRQAEYFTYLLEGRPAPRRHRVFQGWVDPLEAPPDGPPPAARRRLLDVAAMRFVLTTAEAAATPGVRRFLTDAGLRPRDSPDPALRVFENPHALPRAFVTYRALGARDAGARLAAMSRDDFDPLAASFTERDPGLPAAAARRGAPAAIVVDEEHVVEIEATLEAPGLVVLSDAFYPGWEARVDGRPAAIIATNHLFRGVAAPVGRHRVRFEYRPRSFALGAAVSVAALMALAGLWVAGPRPDGAPRDA
jgi:hypothetical protein